MSQDWNDFGGWDKQPDQTPTYNTGQGMTKDPWSNWGTNTFSSGNTTTQQQNNLWDFQNPQPFGANNTASTSPAPSQLDYDNPSNISWQQFLPNVYGQAGAQRQFNELSGIVGDGSPALQSQYGWHSFGPQTNQAYSSALEEAYSQGHQHPELDWSVVNTGNGYGLVSRDKAYHAPQPQPAAYNNYSGGGYRPSGGASYNTNTAAAYPTRSVSNNYSVPTSGVQATASQLSNAASGIANLITNSLKNTQQPPASQPQPNYSSGGGSDWGSSWTNGDTQPAQQQGAHLEAKDKTLKRNLPQLDWGGMVFTPAFLAETLPAAAFWSYYDAPVGLYNYFNGNNNPNNDTGSGGSDWGS